jgi:hypothetical protein
LVIVPLLSEQPTMKPPAIALAGTKSVLSDSRREIRRIHFSFAILTAFKRRNVRDGRQRISIVHVEAVTRRSRKES